MDCDDAEEARDLLRYRNTNVTSAICCASGSGRKHLARILQAGGRRFDPGWVR